MSSVGAAPAGVPDISREDLIRAMHAGGITLVDVLSPDWCASMPIRASVNVPLADLSRRANDVLHDRRAAIVAYCGGPTSPLGAQAVGLLRELGYTNVTHFGG